MAPRLSDTFDDDPRGPVKALGFHNLTDPKVLCYMSSILQVLFHYPRCAKQISQHHHKRKLCIPSRVQEDCFDGCTDGCDDCCKKSFCALCRLKLILDQYWTLKPKADFSALKAYTYSFRKLMFEATPLQNPTRPKKFNGVDFSGTAWTGGSKYADADEFLNWLREMCTGLIAEASEMSLWESMFGKISGMTTGTCPGLNCRKKVQRPDPPEFSLRVLNPEEWVEGEDLTEYIDKFALRSVEECGNENCTTTKKGRNVPVKKKLLEPLPRLLQVTLARTMWNDEARKSTTNPTIPGKLDLSQWCREPTEDAKYELHAVVAHQGEIAPQDDDFVTEGAACHYKTILKNADNQWIELDDQTVTGPFTAALGDDATRERELGYPPKLVNRWQGNEWTPFLIYYRRVQPDELPTIEQEDDEADKPATDNDAEDADKPAAGDEETTEKPADDGAAQDKTKAKSPPKPRRSHSKSPSERAKDAKATTTEKSPPKQTKGSNNATAATQTPKAPTKATGLKNGRVQQLANTRNNRTPIANTTRAGRRLAEAQRAAGQQQATQAKDQQGKKRNLDEAELDDAERADDEGEDDDDEEEEEEEEEPKKPAPKKAKTATGQRKTTGGKGLAKGTAGQRPTTGGKAPPVRPKTGGKRPPGRPKTARKGPPKK